MKIPTEPIGSIPRPLSLLEAIGDRDGTDPVLNPLYEAAIRDTIERFEATGSPVVTDGEQRKYHNFWASRRHSGSATRHNRRLRLLSIQRRHFKNPRHPRSQKFGPVWQELPW